MRVHTNAQSSLIALTAFLLLAISISASAQAPAQQNPVAPGQTQANQVNQPPVQNPFALLDLTQEQVQKIRLINAELKDERAAAVIRLRQAQRALNIALESPNPDEKLMEQRSREFADAQAATVRLSSLTEARVLQVLTQEQRDRLRQIRQRNQAMRRANQQNQRNGLGGQRTNSLQRGTNPPPPLRPNQRRPGRP